MEHKKIFENQINSLNTDFHRLVNGNLVYKRTIYFDEKWKYDKVIQELKSNYRTIENAQRIFNKSRKTHIKQGTYKPRDNPYLYFCVLGIYNCEWDEDIVSIHDDKYIRLEYDYKVVKDGFEFMDVLRVVSWDDFCDNTTGWVWNMLFKACKMNNIKRCDYKKPRTAGKLLKLLLKI